MENDVRTSLETPADADAEQPGAESQDVIFALDIGTRSVIGIVGIPENGLLRVLAVEERLHTRRAVIDGQIEDIAQTALVTRQVKERLEERTGRPLRDVCIAAAGRALKTRTVEYEMDLDEKENVLDKQILELETGAIQQAYSGLETSSPEGESLDFLCVGHSVVNYWLDGYEMSTLLDHRGKRAKVRIIATFLPSEVVESLYAVTMKIGLTVTSVTLEPIAAMNAVIPRELRMLNLALVDVGGGTSDIAVSEGGSVVAYTMATVAGDEITEQIMKDCLVDFETAEQMKLELSKRPAQIEYRDILGFHYEIPGVELEEKIAPAIEQLADEIANRILEVNGKAPAAVFLVGGGCQLPSLCVMLAKRLSIDEKKVAVGGSNYMKRMVSTEEELSGPEFATPVGIAITAMSNRLGKGLSVSINGKKVTLLKNGTSTVLELLLLSGCQYSQIMGRSGASVIYELNGERKVVRGEHSVPAEVRVNGLAASVSTPVRPDDQITFRPAHSGADAAPTLKSELKDLKTVRFLLSDSEQILHPEILLNGSPAGLDQRIQNGDRVAVAEDFTAEEIMKRLQLQAELFHYLVNGVERDWRWKLQHGDIIEVFPIGMKHPSSAASQRAVPWEQEEPRAATAYPGYETPVKGSLSNPQSIASSPFTASAEGRVGLSPRDVGFIDSAGRGSEEKQTIAEAYLKKTSSFIQTEEKLISPTRTVRITLNGSVVELYPKEDGTPYQFVDMLNFVDIDPSKPQGSIVLRLNGRNASYLDMVRNGDEVEIQWGRLPGS